MKVSCFLSSNGNALLYFFFLIFSLFLSFISFLYLSVLGERRRKEEKKERKKERKLMGRGKIEIKRIENTNNRQVTYSKRKNGILKKAKEITVLCDAKVSLVIVGTSGKMVEYCSPNTNLVQQLDTYQKLSHQKLWDAKHENLSNEIDRIKKENDSMQIELRHLKGEDVSSLQFPDLMSLEDALETGLTKIRGQKTEEYNRMTKNDQMLEEQNQQLNYILQQQQEMAAAAAAMNDNMRDFQPFAFRVQPMQPNYQERN